MSQRVSYGACARCGGPVLYQGAAYCSPQCNAAPARPRRSLDSETELARRGCLAPRLACVTWANDRERAIVHHTEAKEHVVRFLDGDELLTGFNIAYDMVVFCAAWPDLIPKVFDVYAADRVSDAMYREKLRDIAEGTYHYADSETEDDGKVYLTYNLAEVAYRRCRIKLDKGGWQLRFGELIDVPMSFWPLDAQQYAVTDAVATDAVWLDQERENRERGVDYFADEYRQARAYFWLQLMGCWGFHTNPAEVREFARKTQQNYERLRDELLLTGIVTSRTNKKTGVTKYTKKKAPVQALVAEEARAKGKRAPLTKEAEKKLQLLTEALERESVPARRASIERKIQKAESSIVTDKDVCGRADHPLLNKYSELSHFEHMLKSDVPLLLLGTEYPIQGRFDLADTGRTTSTLHFGKGNTQNWSTSNGMRECVEPRPGKIFAIGDYSGFELRTWSQICLWTFGRTLMGDMLNKGLDPHLQMAAWILKISYEQALAEFEQDNKGRVYLARQTGKVGNFGLPGGLGAERLIEYGRKNYGVIITPAESVNLKNHWLGWPEASLWLKWAKQRINAKLYQFVHPKSQRVRYVDRFTEYANGPFQALAADAAKAAGFLIARACYADLSSILYGSRPVMFIHDEFVLEVDDDYHAHDKAKELERLMIVGASPFLPDVPPTVEALLGRKWSKAAKPVKDQSGRLVPWVPKVKVAA